MDQHNNPGWAVVMSKPMAEEVAEKAIREAGYGVYLPRSSKVLQATHIDVDGRKRRQRGQIVMRPAFRGYLFAEIWPDQQWRILLDSRHVRGVSDLILRNERPVLLAPALIEAMRECENSGHFDEPRGLRCRSDGPTSRRRTDLADGALVTISSGPFAAFIGKLTGQDDVGRARVLLEIFGRETPIEVENKQLELVGG